MAKFQVFGANTPTESEREKLHRALARRAAADGIVLLKNDGVLPLSPGKVALYGPGSRRTVKGGSGSGDVRERHSVSIEAGLKNAGFSFPNALWMDRFEEKYQRDIADWKARVNEAIRGYSPIRTMDMFIKIGEMPRPNPACTPILPDEISSETDTAIYVLSRQAGEGNDRRVEKGDYLLSDIEEESLKFLSQHYPKLILVLNCGSVMDLSILDCVRIDAVLFFGQGGMEGGNALADVLTGKVSPSARLTDTWAYRYADYPSADTFGHRNGDLENEAYSEGIYVGYRYFDKNRIAPRFAFGHGLSYTTFERRVTSFTADGTKVNVLVSVTNTGGHSGKETVLLYLSKPDGALDCEVRALTAFAKTKTLPVGETDEIALTFDIKDSASFDEAEGAFVLQPGRYDVALSDGTPCGAVELPQKQAVERVHKLGENRPVKACQEGFSDQIKGILSRLSVQEKCMLVTGGGYAIKAYNNVMGAAGRTCTKLLRRGVPNIVMSDGPAGLNVLPHTAIGVEGLPRYPDGLPEDWQWGWLLKTEKLLRHLPGKKREIYRYMTAWPSETVLAQSFDTNLLYEVGEAVGREMKEIGISVWLAPGMNIHRNPLCGRNFEYYSEDPHVSGKMAAAITRGVQSAGGVGVSVKHFCCNNQEDNRMGVSANLSERALREIYLRGFRIAVTEGKPWTVMSSYNRVNGKYVCNSPDLLTRVLREEWGYQGVVMSDWNACDQGESYAAAVNAGNDLIMPGTKKVSDTLLQDYKQGKLSPKALELSAARVLRMILNSETCSAFFHEKHRHNSI